MLPSSQPEQAQGENAVENGSSGETTEQFGTLVLVIGDFCFPFDCGTIAKELETLSGSNISYVICTGNICKFIHDMLKKIATKKFVSVKGGQDSQGENFLKIKIDNFDIAIFNTDHSVPRGNPLDALTYWQRKLQPNILIWGGRVPFTHTVWWVVQ